MDNKSLTIEEWLDKNCITVSDGSLFLTEGNKLPQKLKLHKFIQILGKDTHRLLEIATKYPNLLNIQRANSDSNIFALVWEEKESGNTKYGPRYYASNTDPKPESVIALPNLQN